MKEALEDIMMYGISPFSFMSGTYMTLKVITEPQIAQNNPLYVFAALAIDLLNLAYVSHLLKLSIKGYSEFKRSRINFL